MYVNYSEFEEAAVSAVKKLVAEQLHDFKLFKSMDLTPALERYFISILVNNRFYFEKFLNKSSDQLYARIELSFSGEGLSIFRMSAVGKLIRNSFRHVKFLLTKGSTLGCKSILIVTHHKKFVHYFCSAGLRVDDTSWLLMWHENSISRHLPFGSHLMKLPYVPEQYAYPASILPFFTQLYRLDYFFQHNKPKVVVCAEGDAPYHSLLSEFAKVYGFKSICLQWGIYYDSRWRDIAFSNMKFDRFLSWGNYFIEDLRLHNRMTCFVAYGRPGFAIPSTPLVKKQKIVFLSQGVGLDITKENFDDFVDLCKDIKELLPGFEIVYRPHPAEAFPKIEKYLKKQAILIDKNPNILYHLTESIACVSITSSALVDGILVESIPISYSPGISKHSVAFERINAGFRLNSKEEVIEAVKEIALFGYVYDNCIRSIKQVRPHFFADAKHSLFDYLDSELDNR